MRVVGPCLEMQTAAVALRRSGKRIGLVPTMGALHAGHLSLVALARAEADVVVASIFVNPAQFLPHEDFARYPRDLERDADLCRTAGVDILFHPSAAEIYPADYSTYVEETVLSQGLCGRFRPGHFRGVATVVAKLFNLVQPNVAVFGQKDAQQAAVIRRLVRDLAFPLDVRVAPTVREPDGLAMSSRNRYLSERDRHQALCLYNALRTAAGLYRAGKPSAADAMAAMRDVVMAAGPASIDYIDLVDEDTLEPVTLIGVHTLAALAVRIGATRLIDNMFIGRDA